MSLRERVLGMRERVSLGFWPAGIWTLGRVAVGVWPYGLWTLAVWHYLICARRPGSDYQVPEDQSTPPIPQVPQCPRLSEAWVIGGFAINPEVTSHGGRAGANAIVRSRGLGPLGP